MEECPVCGRELDSSTGSCPDCGEASPPGRDDPRPFRADGPPPLPHPHAGPFPTRAGVLPSGNDPALLGEAKSLGWNWGAFFTPYLWLVGHGRLSAGIFLIITTWIPFLAFIHLFLYPASALYLGFNGYELAWKSQPYHSIEQLRHREREWTMWGIFLAVMFAIGVVFFLIYVRAILEGALSELEQLGW